MTLRELAERYTKEYQFRVFDEDGKCYATLDRNEIVKLEYPIGEKEVLQYSPQTRTLITVLIKW
jgi:hypothetical protein